MKNSSYLKPYVLHGIAKDWPARSWTSESLNKIIGDVQVGVIRNRHGIFDPNPESLSGPVEYRKMSFRKAYALITSKEGRGHYIAQQPAKRGLKALLGDMHIDALPQRHAIFENRHLWFSGAGCYTALHRDGKDNFMIMLKGEKRILLYSPSSKNKMKAFKTKKGVIYSRHDIYASIRENPLNPKPDLTNMPIRPDYDITIREGDCIYIPKNWWHAVQTPFASIAFNMWFLRLFPWQNTLA